MLNQYPSLSWVKSQLRNNIMHSFRKKVHAAYIVGSEAKGTAQSHSDIDIAVIIEPLKTKSSLKVTEEFHHKFLSDTFKAHWENRIVDFQFFYPNDFELAAYDKITLK